MPDGERGRRSGSLLPAKHRRRSYIASAALVGVGIWAAGLAVSGHRVVVGILAAFVLVELGLSAVRGTRLLGPKLESSATEDRVTPMLDQLCARARCVFPRIVVRAESARAAAIVRQKKVTTLLVSETFAARLSDEELGAIVAHEIAHLARGDLEEVKRRKKIAAFVGLVLYAVAVFTSPQLTYFPIWVGAGLFGVFASMIALSPLNRPLEVRADIEGARLCGDPRAMARGLEKSKPFIAEQRALRFGHQPWKTLLWPLSFRPWSHPPIASRIARLEEMAEGWSSVDFPLLGADAAATAAAPVRTSAPTLAPAHVAAAWLPDPSGRYAIRWWDGTRWTKHVKEADGTRRVEPL